MTYDDPNGGGHGGRGQDEVLAGEYVLGVLSLEARRQVEARITSDRAFSQLVDRWQADLQPFDESYPEEKPSAAVFENVQRRLFGAMEQRQRGIWHSIGFWRGLSLVTSAVAVAAVAYVSVIWTSGGNTQPVVAELSAPDNPITLLASFDPSDGHLRVVPVAAQSKQKSLELWLVPGSGNPKSLGVFQPGAAGDMVIPADLRASVKDGATLAVSLEQFGGSPTGLVTGPVIASGSVRHP